MRVILLNQRLTLQGILRLMSQVMPQGSPTRPTRTSQRTRSTPVAMLAPEGPEALLAPEVPLELAEREPTEPMAEQVV